MEVSYVFDFSEQNFCHRKIIRKFLVEHNSAAPNLKGLPRIGLRSEACESLDVNSRSPP
jgi:hypothetical protein